MLDFKNKKCFLYFILFFVVFIGSCAKDKNPQKYDKTYYEEMVFNTNDVFDPNIHNIEIDPIKVEVNE